MAKTNAESKTTKPIEETLWKSANRLCGAIESSEYKHVEPSKADPSLMNLGPPLISSARGTRSKYGNYIILKIISNVSSRV